MTGYTGYFHSYVLFYNEHDALDIVPGAPPAKRYASATSQKILQTFIPGSADCSKYSPHGSFWQSRSNT